MHPDESAEPAANEPSKAPPRPCPICGKPSVPTSRPFCSKRCADVDLHRWLGGVYAIPVSSEPEATPTGGQEGGKED